MEKLSRNNRPFLDTGQVSGRENRKIKGFIETFSRGYDSGDLKGFRANFEVISYRKRLRKQTFLLCVITA